MPLKCAPLILTYPSFTPQTQTSAHLDWSVNSHQLVACRRAASQNEPGLRIEPKTIHFMNNEILEVWRQNYFSLNATKKAQVRLVEIFACVLKIYMLSSNSSNYQYSIHRHKLPCGCFHDSNSMSPLVFCPPERSLEKTFCRIFIWNFVFLR